MTDQEALEKATKLTWLYGKHSIETLCSLVKYSEDDKLKRLNERFIQRGNGLVRSIWKAYIEKNYADLVELKLVTV